MPSHDVPTLRQPTITQEQTKTMEVVYLRSLSHDVPTLQQPTTTPTPI